MKKNWWSSLRIKIIAWSFVPTVIILSAVAWFTFYSYQEVIGDLAIKQDQAIAREKAMQAQTAISSLVNPPINSILLDIDIQHEEPLEIRAENILNQAKNLEIFDGGIYFLDQYGKVFKTWPEQPELIGQDWSDTLQFRFIRDYPGQAAALTDLQSIKGSGKEIVCSTLSMRDQQEKFVGAGYYCLTIRPVTQNAYYEIFNNLDLGQGVYVLDGNQRIIFSSDPSLVGGDLSGEGYLRQLLQGQSMSGRFRKGTGDMVISYFPVALVASDSLRWIVLKEQSWAEILQPSWLTASSC